MRHIHYGEHECDKDKDLESLKKQVALLRGALKDSIEMIPHKLNHDDVKTPLCFACHYIAKYRPLLFDQTKDLSSHVLVEREVLEDIEFCHYDVSCDMGFCPLCKNGEASGHHKDCKLRALLGEGEK